MTESPPLRLVVLMPLKDDWFSAAELIRRIDKSIAPGVCSIDIIIVDDGSVMSREDQNFQSEFLVVRSICALRLRRNLGHQRAIAIGLSHIQQNRPCDAVIVMDSDGEDTADGMAKLVRAYSEMHGTKAIFAERTLRSESLLFRFFYRLYKMLHRVLTGISVRVGNFSILPRAHLNTLVILNELWNHYAAALFRSNLPFTMTPIARGNRIAGSSKMNFVALVSHGLSAISVFGDIVGVRVLIASLSASMLAGVGIVLVILIRLFTDQAIPGWATYATGTLAVIMIQLVALAGSFTFFMLNNRTALTFVPLRDYSLFVEGAETIYQHE